MTYAKKTQETEVGANQLTGFVYFFLSADCEAIKIGFTTEPDMRLANAKTWTPEDANWEDIYPGTLADETAIHQRLAAHHIKREWFHFSDEVAEFLEDLQDARIALNLERFGDPNVNEIPIAELLRLEER